MNGLRNNIGILSNTTWNSVQIARVMAGECVAYCTRGCVSMCRCMQLLWEHADVCVQACAY